MKSRKTSTAFLAAALIFQCTTLPGTDRDDNKFERVRLNTAALAYAKALIDKGQIVPDGKGAWANDRPAPEAENEFIRQHGFGEYVKWHLGIDDRYAENTKRRYKFPYGDFKDVHRCALLAVKARAHQYDHVEIENAAGQLLEMVAWRQRR